MVKKVQESKAAKAAKISKTGSKEKKRWTSGKHKEETSRLATVEPELFQKIAKDAANMKIITRTNIVEKYNLNMSSAVRVLRYLCESEVITQLSKSRRLILYCGAKFAKKDVIEEVTKKDNDGLEAWA
ncbi:40S ribosomal protein S25 [Pseudoloma neurophilia]|uniref:40S ribosomal protein S25 n=1 Tax=Pseudoloma neurophilia TaxID=146866 RepID=A0A0R0LYR4_9MICR|nr:40S ribosomal protein S25 [Pseudoloma neurophilia]